MILIVCEGAKTEPNYINGLRLAFELSSVNIRVMQPPGSDPMSIVTFAIRQMKSDPEYDRAYCLFDRDQHTNFDRALQLIAVSEYGRTGRLFAITSVPCFEVWILLHYRYSTGAYTASRGESACARVIKDVHKFFPDYEKGHQGAFGVLAALLDQAVAHAQRLEQHNAETENFNPATQMHHLVSYLRGLRSRG